MGFCVLPMKTRFPKIIIRLSKPCIPCKLIKMHCPWTGLTNKKQERNPIRNIHLGMNCSFSTSLFSIYQHLAVWHVYLYIYIYMCVCVWLSLIGIIWHIISYCRLCIYCAIISHYIAYYIFDYVASHTVLLWHLMSWDIVHSVSCIILGRIIYHYCWLLFSITTAYHTIIQFMQLWTFCIVLYCLLYWCIYRII